MFNILISKIVVIRSHFDASLKSNLNSSSVIFPSPSVSSFSIKADNFAWEFSILFSPPTDDCVPFTAKLPPPTGKNERRRKEKPWSCCRQAYSTHSGRCFRSRPCLLPATNKMYVPKGLNVVQSDKNTHKHKITLETLKASSALSRLWTAPVETAPPPAPTPIFPFSTYSWWEKWYLGTNRSSGSFCTFTLELLRANSMKSSLKPSCKTHKKLIVTCWPNRRDLRSSPVGPAPSPSQRCGCSPAPPCFQHIHSKVRPPRLHVHKWSQFRIQSFRHGVRSDMEPCLPTFLILYQIVDL